MFFALIGLALLVVAGLLIDSHRRTWYRRQAELVEPRDKPQQRAWRAARGEYIRRMIASGTVAAMGLLLGARDLVPDRPLAMVVYVLLLVLGCLWLMMLAMFDAWASMLRLSNTASQQETARILLERELEKARQKAQEQENE
jgi:hypothetical protein